MLRRLTVSIAILTACVARAPSPSPVQAPTCTPVGTDDDLSDLAPLGEIVGDARVVALGEATHAGGGAFVAKARVVRYLHEKKGFDVLAFESSLWACESGAVSCLAWPWAGAKEVDSVLAWAKQRGMTTTGFDPQISGGQARLDAFESWVAKELGPGPELAPRLRTAFARYPKMGKFRLLSTTDRATDVATFRDARALAVTKGDPLLVRALDDVLVVYAWHESVGAERSTTIDWDGHAENNDVRDRAMAEDVRWLLDVRHPGKKLVLWVASAHAQKDAQLVEFAGYAKFHSMGSWLSSSLGKGYVAIAFGAQGGRIGNEPIPEQDLAPAPADAIERACTTEHGLLRLSTAPRVGRLLGYQPFRAPWGKAFDAAIVLGTTTPVTR